MIDVTDIAYGGDPQSGVSNYQAIMDAIQAAIDNGGDEVYFPPGRYEIQGSGANKEPIYKTGANKIKLYGEGAIIDCDTGDPDSYGNGAGGGFTLVGDNIVVEGLRFEGQVEVIDDDPHDDGRLLWLDGDYNTVKNCYFKDGNGGAVEIIGNYNLVTSNIFDKCNNYRGGLQYGSIQIEGASKYNTISKNKIFQQFYAAICAKGTGTSGDLAYLDIVDNYTRSNSTYATGGHSRGLYLLEGANQQIKIDGNTIEDNDREGILIHSKSDYGSDAKKCIITNNIIKDCDKLGISLDSLDSGGKFEDFIISGNIIENTSAALNYTYQIYLERVRDSLISNNKCTGAMNGESFVGVGIHMANSPVRLQINDNQMRLLSTGISFLSAGGALKDNHAYDCAIGFTLGYCRGASVVGNIAHTCDVVGINYITDSSPLHIVANALVDCAENYSGTVVPEVLSFSGSATGTYDPFVVTGILDDSDGEQTVDFGNIYDGDRFIVMPGNESGSVIDDSIFISLIDKDGGLVHVKSTSSSDGRGFTVIKVISAGNV